MDRSAAVILVKAVLGVWLLFMPGHAVAGQQDEAPSYVRQDISENISVLAMPELPGADNIGLVRSRGEALLVETSYPEFLGSVTARIAEAGAQNFKFILNTHYHHAHANAAFADRGLIVGHESLAGRLSEAQKMYGMMDFEPLPAAALPDIYVRDFLKLRVGELDVILHHLPGAHTDGDLVVLVPAEQVAFTGDLFVNMLGITDYESGGSFEGFLNGLDWLLENLAPGWTIVPGHGEVADYAILAEFRDLVDSEQARITGLLEDGLDRDRIVEAGLPECWAHWEEKGLPAHFFLGNIIEGLSRSAAD